jgi:cytosolic 5'-nucleotidase 3
MDKNVVIVNQVDFEEKKKKILSQGFNNLHLISDFDGTLTKAFVNEKKLPSLISLLRSSNYMSEKYSKEAYELYNQYHPIEISNIPKEEKIRKMNEWWKKHFDLMVVCGLNMDVIKKVILESVEKGTIELRDKSLDLLKKLHKNKVPLIIMSAGTGDLIQEFLSRKSSFFENIKIIANFLKFDKNGQVIGVKEPIIHSMNKNEFQIKNFDFFYEIEKRKNVILLGDKPEDLDMIEGFEPKTLIKIGFLNENIEENLENFKKVFDVIILNDGSMKFMVDFLKEIK